MKFNIENANNMLIHLEDLAKTSLCYNIYLLVEDYISLDKMTSKDGSSYYDSIGSIMGLLYSIPVENTSEYEAPEVKEYLAEVRKCLGQVYEE